MPHICYCHIIEQYKLYYYDRCILGTLSRGINSRTFRSESHFYSKIHKSKSRFLRVSLKSKTPGEGGDKEVKLSSFVLELILTN